MPSNHYSAARYVLRSCFRNNMFLSIGLIHSDLISEKGIVRIPAWSRLLRQTFPNCGGVLVAKMAIPKHCEDDNDDVSSDDDDVINCDFGISRLPSRTKVVN